MGSRLRSWLAASQIIACIPYSLVPLSSAHHSLRIRQTSGWAIAGIKFEAFMLMTFKLVFQVFSANVILDTAPL